MSAPAVRRFVRWLRGSGRQERDRHRAAAAVRVDQARADARKWKARATETSVRERAADQRASALERQLRVVRQRLAVVRRETPSVDIVRQAFPRWTETLAARVGAHRQQGGEQRLIAVSASYRAVSDAVGGAPGPEVQRAECDGLPWWVPAPSTRKRANAAAAARLRFPYRSILQTRGVTTGGIMLDLGANVGRMTVPRVILGDATLAYCAEPDPVSYACLVRNVMENGLRGLVLPDQTAIGDRDGIVRFLRAGGHGNYRVVPDGTSDGGEIVDVPCATLDTWVTRLEIDLAAVTFIKVDVEGFERRVLAGASRVLARPHIVWQMEVKPAGLRAVGDDPQQLYADLQRSFTHFIDMNRNARGSRVRSVSELSDALSYIEPREKTDVLLFSSD